MAISVRLANEEQTSAVHKCEESVIKYSYSLGDSLKVDYSSTQCIFNIHFLVYFSTCVVQSSCFLWRFKLHLIFVVKLYIFGFYFVLLFS